MPNPLYTYKQQFQAIQFSISTQFISIWPIDRTLSDATTPGQSGPGSVTIRVTLHSLKLQHYWNITILFFSVISRTLVGGEGVLTLCREAVSVFYSPSRPVIILPLSILRMALSISQGELLRCLSLWLDSKFGFRKFPCSSEVFFSYFFFPVCLFDSVRFQYSSQTLSWFDIPIIRLFLFPTFHYQYSTHLNAKFDSYIKVVYHSCAILRTGAVVNQWRCHETSACGQNDLQS